MTRSRPEPSQLLRLALPIVAIVWTLLLLPIPDVREGSHLTALSFGATGPVPGILDLVAGQSLLLAGSLAWLSGLRARIGVLCVLAGIAWFGPDLFGSIRADPAVRAVGRFLLTPFLLPVLLHLALATLGRDGDRRTLRSLGVIYAAAATVAVAGVVTYEAFRDASCLDCTWSNPLLVISGYGFPRYRRISEALLVAIVGIAIGVVAVRWLAVRHEVRAPRTFVAVAALGISMSALIRGWLLVVSPKEDPRILVWAGMWGLLIISVLTLAGGVTWLAMESWRRAVRLRDMVASLETAPGPGSVGQALGRALHDPTLQIGYWLDDPDRYVDARGSPVKPHALRGTTLTPIERDGGRLAVIMHADHVESGALAEAFGPAMLVALDNERLAAARLAQLEELRASRARIVAVGDAERRRLERDLHDGAQQQLLSILFDLRLARLQAERSGDHDRATRLAVCEHAAQDAVDELRRVAFGIHPAVLSRSGLVAALSSLADEAPIPVEVDAETVGRVPEQIETAAYLAVTEYLAAAQERGASGLGVRVRRVGPTLELEVQDDAPEQGNGVPVRIADRVGAAGGEATAEPLAIGGTLLRVELPCA